MDLSTMLVKHIPELEEPLRQETSEWSTYGVTTLGPDAVFGTVLAPYVIELLKQRPVADEVLQRIFVFLEDLAASESEAALSAVYVSFGEALVEDAIAFRRAEQYFGPTLRRGFQHLLSHACKLNDPGVGKRGHNT